MDYLNSAGWQVHSKISSFEFEMQDSSNFKISLSLPGEPNLLLYGIVFRA